MADPVDPADIAPLVAAGWHHDAAAGTLRRSYRFPDFVSAFGFMTRAAIWAEKWNHHPDWRNVYNVVDLRLTTHDAGGLTKLDTDMAAVIDRYAGPAEVQRDQAQEIQCLCQSWHAKP